MKTRQNYHGLVVIVLPFYSNDPSLSPVKLYSCLMLFEKNKNN